MSLEDEPGGIADPPARVSRLCTGNRYCNSVGPFYKERLYVIDDPVRRVVGGCWAEDFDRPHEESRYVCSRCAHRRLVFEGGAGSGWKVWILCCPFDGEPLGRGEGGVLIDGQGNVLHRFAGSPGPGDHEEVFRRLRGTGPDLSHRTAEANLEAAIDRFGHEAYEEALALAESVFAVDPENPLAWTICQRCYEQLGRESDARRARDRVRSLEQETS